MVTMTLKHFFKYCTLLVEIKNFYKHTNIDLSRQTNTSIPQEINFKRKLKEDDSATMFFIVEKQKKNYSKVLFKFTNCNRLI